MKHEPTKSTVLDALEDAASIVADLQQEMEDWRDNMSNANMEHLPKFDEVSETADLLQDADLERRVEAVREAVERLAEGRAFVAGCPEHVEGQKCSRCKWNGVAAPLNVIPPLIEYTDSDRLICRDQNGARADVARFTCGSTTIWAADPADPTEIASTLESARKYWWKHAEYVEKENKFRLGERQRREDIPAEEPFPSDAVQALAEKVISYSTTKKRRPSRHDRLDEAQGAIESATSAIREAIEGCDDPEDRLSDLQTALDDLAESLDSLQNVSFPGMFS